ncbi:putative glycosidase CRH2 [Coemansia biformis]|uniref:Glycosidase CRH2 n=1 Tax=Coemansia biformis TaxID=1286918 RepID=A0A9W7YK79_9FUNG|nr:putative glycosidase CRH2 [Coemansia biformis]
MGWPTALAVAAGALATMVSGTNTCSQWAPCYREGYCDASAMFCMWDLCDPSKSFNATSCWKPEGCVNQAVSFDSVTDVVSIKKYSGNPNTNPFVSVFEPDYAKIADGKLVLEMPYDSKNNRGFGSTVDSSHSFKYGTVTARIKTASIAKGVVSSFIIRSNLVGDEIDFEWVGKDPREVQTNFFYHDILNYTNSKSFDVGGDTSAAYHDYTIVWASDSITWIVDGKKLRTLYRKDTYDRKSGEYRFPAAEGRIGFSVWDGGNSGAQGTAEWAGFPTPWTKDTVYRMSVDSINIQCSGDNPPPASSTGGGKDLTSSATSKSSTTISESRPSSSSNPPASSHPPASPTASSSPAPTNQPSPSNPPSPSNQPSATDSPAPSNQPSATDSPAQTNQPSSSLPPPNKCHVVKVTVAA